MSQSINRRLKRLEKKVRCIRCTSIANEGAEYTFSEINPSNEISLLKDGVPVSTIDLTPYLDDTNLARLVSGVLDAAGNLTVTRDDSSSFCY